MNKALDKVILVIAAIGAINWGLTALGYNIVSLIVGTWPIIESIVYYIIALCGIWALIKVFQK